MNVVKNPFWINIFQTESDKLRALQVQRLGEKPTQLV